MHDGCDRCCQSVCNLRSWARFYIGITGHPIASMTIHLCQRLPERTARDAPDMCIRCRINQKPDWQPNGHFDAGQRCSSPKVCFSHMYGNHIRLASSVTCSGVCFASFTGRGFLAGDVPVTTPDAFERTIPLCAVLLVRASFVACSDIRAA
jgi:hypothetical protein